MRSPLVERSQPPPMAVPARAAPPNLHSEGATGPSPSGTTQPPQRGTRTSTPRHGAANRPAARLWPPTVHRALQPRPRWNGGAIARP